MEPKTTREKGKHLDETKYFGQTEIGGDLSFWGMVEVGG